MPSTRLPQQIVVVMAVAAGLAVANSYYAQPLLPVMAKSLHTSTATAGLVVTLSQLGYACGLFFLVPLGDLVERRTLVSVIGNASAIALVGVGLAPSAGFLLPAAFALGLLAIQSPVIVPYAAALAGENERGRVVGTVMTGLLLGILLARTVAGYLAEAWSWRLVYFIAGAVMVVQAAVLRRLLPSSHERVELRYAALLRSLARVVGEEPVLRLRSLYGALSMAAFSAMWTSIAFLLARPPYGFGEGTIGLVGLAGAAGAIAATVSGRLADRQQGTITTGAGIALLAASWVLLWSGRHSLAALLAGVVVLDVAVQGIHITNQTQIFRLRPDSRSRINSVYMMAYFLGGAVGSSCSAVAYHRGGWRAVCVVGFAFSAALVLAWLVTSTAHGARRKSHTSSGKLARTSPSSTRTR